MHLSKVISQISKVISPIDIGRDLNRICCVLGLDNKPRAVCWQDRVREDIVLAVIGPDWLATSWQNLRLA